MASPTPTLDLDHVLGDREFHDMPVEQRRAFLLRHDPDFGGLPSAEQNRFLDRAKSRVVTRPISGLPPIPGPPLPKELQPDPTEQAQRRAMTQPATRVPAPPTNARKGPQGQYYSYPIPKVMLPPLPGDLAPPVRSEGMDRRTGRRFPMTPSGTGPLGFLDWPVEGAQQAARGVEALAEPVENLPFRGNMSPADRDLMLRRGQAAMSDVIGGGLKMATPVMAGGLVAAPVKGLVTLGGAELTREIAKKGIAASGGSPEAAQLTGDVAGLAVGGGLLSRFARKLDLHNAEANRLVELERTQGLQKEAGEQLAQKNFGKPILVIIDREPYTVELLGVGKRGRPALKVVNKTRKTVFAGNGEKTLEFLRMQEAEGVAGDPGGQPSEAEQPNSPVDLSRERAWVKQLPASRLRPVFRGEGIVAEAPATKPQAKRPQAAEEHVLPPVPGEKYTAPGEPSTIPETTATVETQIEQLGSGKRKAVMVPTAIPMPSKPPGMRIISLPEGRFVFDPKKTNEQEIKSAIAQHRLSELLGHSELGYGAPDKRDIDPADAHAAVVRDKKGETVQAVATDTPHIGPALQAAEAVKPAGGSVALEDPGRELQHRLDQHDGALPPSPDGPPAALLPQTPAFVDQLHRILSSGGTIKDNPALNQLADQAYGGTRAAGAHSSREVYDALEAAVNRWVLDNGPRLMTLPGPEALAEVRGLMGRLPTQTDRTQEQVDFQQFSTPPSLAMVATHALGIRPGEVVMEPSAGVGGLASWARAAGANVQTNEIAPRRTALLRHLGFEPTEVNAELLNDTLAHSHPDLALPTAVLMNPPFSATGGRVKAHKNKYGLSHITQALQRVQEGGRVVAIMGQGVAMDRPSAEGFWRKLAETHNIRANISLPGAEYRKYGTDFPNQLIVIDKSGPTPGNSWKQKLSNIEWGTVDSLEEALDAIRPLHDRPSLSPGAGQDAGAAVVGTGPGDLRTGAAGPGVPAGVGGGGVQPGPHGRVSPDPQTRPAQGPAIVPQPEPGPGPVEARPGGSVQGGVSGPVHVRGGVGPDVGRNEASRDRTEEAGGTFTSYTPQKLNWNVKHPAKIVEASSMAAIEPPDITYSANLPDASMQALSDVQLEAVVYAGQRHAQTLPNGHRAGYFIGDGTGVGKGREIAGILFDNWNQGHRRAAWVSISRDLIEDAKRDLTDIGATEVAEQVRSLNDWQDTAPVEHVRGVVFTTYSTMAKEKRLKQLATWLGEDGIIVFDESHAAKNVDPTGMSEPTARGLAVKKIQEDLPGARVVYVSATGATEPRNMAYMTRLGLWGPGTAFPGGFQQFLNEVENGGVGALEMVARDLKALGMYSSRTISYEGVQYRESIHELTDAQRSMYNAGAQLWQVVQKQINSAMGTTNAPAQSRAMASSQFWSSHQRFFNTLTTAFKIPTVIKEAERALAEGHSVIVDLNMTGEAQAERTIRRGQAEGADLEDLDFSPKDSIGQMVMNIFPINQYEDATDPDTGRTIKVLVVDGDGNPIVSQAALAARTALMDKLDIVNLPDNPLDQIINHFGPSAVAEITGRKRRLVVNPVTGKREYQRIAGENIPMSKKNVEEARQFNSGQKRIAIISPAGSTGISLHADARFKNQQVREHFVAQLSWSADSQVQKFGRSHRSNQVQPPIYTLFSTDVGGEKRFSATIARRLASLGALTKGQRDATGGGELAKYNFESEYGQAAVDGLYHSIRNSEVIPGLENPIQVMQDMGIMSETGEIRDTDAGNVPKFLNRLLAVDVDQQNALFASFLDRFDSIVRNAKEQGQFDEGVADLKGVSVRVKSSKVVHREATTKAETQHYLIEMDEETEPVTFETMAELYAKREQGGLGLVGAPDSSGFYRQGRSGNLIYADYAHRITDPSTGATERTYRVFRPHGEDDTLLRQSELEDKFETASPLTAESEWRQKHRESPKFRTVQRHVIAGAIMPIWNKLKTSKSARLKIVRTTTDDGQRIVGVLIPNRAVGEILAQLGVEISAQTAEEIFQTVLGQGQLVKLTDGIGLRRVTFKEDDAIQITGLTPFQYAEIRAMGVVSEIVNYKNQFFVPTEPRRGIEVLTRITGKYRPLKVQNGCV